MTAAAIPAVMNRVKQQHRVKQQQQLKQQQEQKAHSVQVLGLWEKLLRVVPKV